MNMFQERRLVFAMGFGEGEGQYLNKEQVVQEELKRSNAEQLALSQSANARQNLIKKSPSLLSWLGNTWKGFKHVFKKAFSKQSKKQRQERVNLYQLEVLQIKNLLLMIEMIHFIELLNLSRRSRKITI